jgi:glycerophosphoryl diester phosphodiesterase
VPGLSDLISTRSAQRRLRRVGHKGADLIAPGNTFASFDAALAAGVDMIEFDVLPERRAAGRAQAGGGCLDPRWGGRLVAAHAAGRAQAGGGRSDPREGQRLILAHDYEHDGDRAAHSLSEALAYLATDRFAGVELDVDLKLPGYELAVLEALREHGLLTRALISSQYRESLATIRAAEPAVRLGWSVPKVRRDPFASRALTPVALAWIAVARVVLPYLAAAAVEDGSCDALMVHWRLVTPRLVRSVRRSGGEIFVWTVDELPRIRALDALGVTGVISNDPRLFAALPAPA